MTPQSINHVGSVGAGPMPPLGLQATGSLLVASRAGRGIPVRSHVGRD